MIVLKSAPTYYRHSACVCGGSMYVFGGNADGSKTDKMLSYSFALHSFIPEKYKSTSVVPDARIQHRSVSYQGNLYVFGGQNGLQKLNDFYKYVIGLCYYLLLLFIIIYFIFIYILSLSLSSFFFPFSFHQSHHPH